jgi:hypothetical protein
MSLWEKWERESLEKQGIKVKHHSDVDIQDTRIKADWHKQTWIVVGTIAACLFVVYAAMVFEALFEGRRWSDTYIVHLFAEREAQREDISNK